VISDPQGYTVPNIHQTHGLKTV